MADVREWSENEHRWEEEPPLYSHPLRFSRRWRLLLIVVGALLLIGFYSVTDPVRLAHDHLLDGADYAGYALCHRITERSFSVAGRQLPLCARCTGMYLGVLLSFLALGLAGRWRWSDLPRLPVLLVMAALVGLMGIDGLNSYSHFFPDAPHLYEPRNWLRLLTGMGTGLSMGIVVFAALAQTLWRHQVRRPVVGSLREMGGLALLGSVAVLLVLSNQPSLLYVLAIGSAFGVLLILSGLNSVVLLIALGSDATAVHGRQIVWPLLAGLSLAVVEISLIGLVRFQLTGTMTGFPGL